MKLIEALRQNKKVAIIFVDVEHDSQWTITFTKETDITGFFNAIAGDLDFVSDTITDQSPVNYCKAIFISNKNPREEDWDKLKPDGLA